VLLEHEMDPPAAVRPGPSRSACSR
jgi:hypothetical protein